MDLRQSKLSKYFGLFGLMLHPQVWWLFFLMIPSAALTVAESIYGICFGRETPPMDDVPAERELIQPDPLDAHSDQLREIRYFELPKLIDAMPSESWYQSDLHPHLGEWSFDFECRFANGKFQTWAIGNTPRDAFLKGREMLTRQLQAWHAHRFDEPVATDDSTFQPRMPRVLIVDDDVDAALAMQTALNGLGCQTTVATTHEGLHRKIISEEIDYIFLDWKLGDDITGGMVVSRASRLIETFSDLRDRFSKNRPRIVTHSALGREKVELSSESKKYFSHHGHWQKPLSYSDLMDRASELMAIH